MRVLAFEDCLRTLRHFRVDPAEGSAIDVGGTKTVVLASPTGRSTLSRNPLLTACRDISFLDEGFNADRFGATMDLQVDFLDPQEVARLENKYDLVLSFDTLEHVSNPFLFCKHLLSIAKAGRYVYVSTVFNYVYHPSPKDFFRFSPEGLRQCFLDPAYASTDPVTVLWAGWESDRNGVAALACKAAYSGSLAEYNNPPANLPWRIRARAFLTGLRGLVSSK